MITDEEEIRNSIDEGLRERFDPEMLLEIEKLPYKAMILYNYLVLDDLIADGVVPWDDV